jgi:hypothetical protein
MGNSAESVRDEEIRPFSGTGNDAARWQQIYRDAVVIAHSLQRHGVDPHEIHHFTPQAIHTIFMNEKIYTFEEQLVFDVAFRLLAERHSWSYGQ